MHLGHCVTFANLFVLLRGEHVKMQLDADMELDAQGLPVGDGHLMAEEFK